MIKLIAIDMDGTLLDERKQLPQENVLAIQEARKEGIKIVICTGRPMTGVRPFVDALELSENDFIIINNGCSTYQVKDWTLVDSRQLTDDEMRYLDQLSQADPEVQLTLFDDTHAFNVVGEPPSDLVTYDASIVFTVPKQIDLEEHLANKHKTFQAMFLGEEAHLDQFQSTYESSLQEGFSTVRSQSYIFEILPFGTSKASALSRLADRLGFSSDEVMAIGDAANDLEMLSYAGVSVAMGNASEAVKAVADYETTSNDDAGVANAICRYALNQTLD